MPGPRTLIFIPTYNERENVEKIYHKIAELELKADVLFLDDNSPDGTGRILDQLALDHSDIRVIHRKRKTGIGSAHLDGIRWAYDHGYAALVTMDCDFTHPPRHIPEFIKKSEDCPVVVGSRWLQKKSLIGWNPYRLLLTRGGHWLTSWLLGLPHDASGAYRLYRLDRIPRELFDMVRSRGYSFFFECLYLLHENRYPIAEIAITLPARTYGHSKMTLRNALHSVVFLLTLALTRRLNPQMLRLMPSSAPVSRDHGRTDGPETSAEWDAYWLKRKNASGVAFDLIAAFYRKYIIKRTLNHFIRLHFKPGAEILHAGCGSGQVDDDIARTMRITALDISQRALDIYRNVNGNRSHLLHGSVFRIPLENASMDGVYNLGVMEHFTEDQIDGILREFHRVLRNGGKAVLFWPPEFGTSVFALKLAHFMLNRVLGRNVKLHPDEITRVRSRRHVRAMLEKADFKLERFYFGPKDFFTHAVIIASKAGGARIRSAQAQRSTASPRT